MSSKPTLTYFAGRGRAEPARLIMAEAGVEYNDNRITSLDAIKATLPFGQVPAFEVEGKVIAQSWAICRYLARTHGLYGKSELEGAQADMLVYGIEDLATARHNAKSDEEKTNFATNVLPKWLTNFEKLLKSNKDGKEFFVGDNITFADIVVYYLMAEIYAHAAAAFDHFPLLKAHMERIAARPKIAHWISVRPQTPW